jgi:hypothetical protein
MGGNTSIPKVLLELLLLPTHFFVVYTNNSHCGTQKGAND